MFFISLCLYHYSIEIRQFNATLYMELTYYDTSSTLLY